MKFLYNRKLDIINIINSILLIFDKYISFKALIYSYYSSTSMPCLFDHA